MPTKAQRSYSAFLRETKAHTGASHREAVAAYRALKNKGATPSGALVRRDPGAVKSALKTARTRITKSDNAARAAAEAAAAKKAASLEKRRATIAAKKQAAAALKAPARPTSKRGAARAEAAAAAEAGGEVVLKIQDGDEWDTLAPWLWEDAEWEHYHAGGSYSYTDHK